MFTPTKIEIQLLLPKLFGFFMHIFQFSNQRSNRQRAVGRTWLVDFYTYTDRHRRARKNWKCTDSRHCLSTQNLYSAFADIHCMSIFLNVGKHTLYVCVFGIYIVLDIQKCPTQIIYCVWDTFSAKIEKIYKKNFAPAAISVNTLCYPLLAGVVLFNTTQ